MSPAQTDRLLYRGALSLPDSNLLLDGLTFSVPTTSLNLLQNPLALALESMRGRPSLSFVRVEKIHDLWLDFTGDVHMDIHPHAILSRIYFENTFCLLPCEPQSVGGRSTVGVRVVIGDVANIPSTHSTASTGTTEMIIYARPTPLPQNNAHTQSQVFLELCVARITPDPPPPRVRLPRPDDPTPRRPPLVFKNVGGKRRRALDGGAGTVAHASAESGVARLGSGVRVGLSGDAVFKVPVVPVRRNTRVGVAGDEHNPDPSARFVRDIVDDEIEKANKTLLKKTAVEQLAMHGVSRAHPEFTELFGFVYRGATFALRATAQASRLDRPTVQHAVEAHVRMYVRGVTDWDIGIPAYTASVDPGTVTATARNRSGSSSRPRTRG